MAYLKDDDDTTFTGETLLAPSQVSYSGYAALAPITISATVGPDQSGDGKQDLNLTAPGSSGTINGAIFADAVKIGAGTGNYNTFLALKDNNDAGAWESGFNTNDTPPIDNSNPEIDHAKTEAVLLGAVPVTEVDGVLYYEFRVDLNEANSGVNSQISLDQFQIYVSTNGGITMLSVLQAQTKVYDMDAGTDVSVLLSEEFSSGSGVDDYVVLVPAALFAGFNPTTYYLYLFVEMGHAGANWGVNGGFEEWNLANAVILQGSKFEDTNGNGVRDEGEGPIEGVLVYIDENKDGFFNFTDTDGSGDFNSGDIALERYTYTDDQGNYYFGSVGLGSSDFTLWIDEVVPLGYEQTTGSHEVVLIDSDAAPGTILIVDPIGNKPLIPSITIDKIVDYLIDGADIGTAGNDGAGDKIVYYITVHNDGDLALTNVVVTDPNADGGSITYVSGDTGSDGIMGVGETWIYSAVHTITQPEIDGKGSDADGVIDGDNDIDNVATVDADSVVGPVTDSDPADQVIQYLPNFSVLKQVTSITDGDDFGGEGQADSDGDVINYLITVTNTGHVTLTNFTYTDANADGDTITIATSGNGDANLDVGETWTFTATHTVTQAELDSPGSDNSGALDDDGDVDNKVIVDFDEVGPKDSSVETDLVYAPDFTVQKAVTSITDDDDFGGEGQADSAGDVINYSITIINTGNITLTNFTYDDQNADGDTLVFSDMGNGDGNLDVGETWVLTGSHTVTQDELDSPGSDNSGALDEDGDVDNKVVVDFDEAGPKDSSVETDLVYAPDFIVSKVVTSITDDDDFGNDGQADSAGDVINYLVTVTNTGNITLTNFTYDDDNADGPLVVVLNGNGDANLDVGETWTFTATHTVTQDELNSPGSDETGALDEDGDVDNWVTVDFDEVDPKTGKVETPLVYIAAIGLEKYVSVNPGDGYIDWAEADSPTGPVTSFLSDAMFFVEVVNEGNVTLTGLSFVDELTSPISMAQTLDYAALGAMVDVDGDGDIDDSFANLDAADGTTDGTLGTLILQPGDAIGIYYSLPFVQGQHTNTVYVDSDQTDAYNDPANYYGLVNDGEGVRTPGFWQNPNNGLTFWDGIDGNEAHSGEGFPEHDLLYDVYVKDTNHDGKVDYNDAPSKGLLVGDWNMNGLADDGNTIFIPYDVAVALVSGGGGADAGEKIGRDVVATWLNWLNGNSLGDPSDPGSPHHYLDEAIDWLQEFVSDKDDADVDFANFLDDGFIKSNSKAWKTGVDADGPSGRAIHNALDSYNNDGTIGTTEFAGDADNAAFIFALKNLATVEPMQEFAKFDDGGFSSDMTPALDMTDMMLLA